jgi:predicted acylesterase/phospholipase RssA
MEIKDDQSGERLLLNMVLEGGGAKGIAYVGMLEALEQQPTTDIAAVAGASAGAITAMLIAAKYTAAEILNHLPTALGHLGAQIPQDVSGLWSIIKQHRIIKSILQRLRATGAALDNTQLRDWLGECLAKKLGVNDGTIVTFGELFDKTQIELFVVAANVSKGRLMAFHHKITPDCEVVDAVLASSAIPGALPAGKVAIVESRQHEPKRVHTLVDGGVWANFPDFVFKDESFRGYWDLGAVNGIVVGFLLHETNKCIKELSHEDFPREAEVKEMRSSESSAQFGDTGDLNRTEAVLREEGTDPQKYGVFNTIVFLTGVALFLGSLAGPLAWAPLRDLRLIVPIELISVGLVFWGLLVLPQTSQSKSSNEHGWPRNRFTNVADIVLGLLSSWRAMVIIWGCIIIGLALAIANYPIVSASTWFLGWLVVMGFAILLLSNFLAIGSVAALHKALRDWGWGVARTLLVSSGAPQWRGQAAGDLIVYLPIPKEVSTLSFTVHTKTLPQSKTLLIDRIKDIAKVATDEQLKSIFPAENHD